jgi:hypothetical protein
MLSARPSNPFPDLVRLYKEDRSATLLLLEEASITCVPQLKEVRSSAVRGLLARTLIFGIETSRNFGNKSTREEQKQKLSQITDPVMRNASEGDVAILKNFMRRPDRSEVVSCIARAAVETSISRSKSAKRLLEGVEMRQ